jgi:peroxiredoxin
VSSFELQDFRGKTWSLNDFRDRKAVVIAFVGVECPLVAQYIPRLKSLAEQWDPRGVAVLAIDANQQDSLSEIAQFAQVHKWTLPILKDPGHRIADRLDARRTPEVFVLDQDRRVVYCGRIDDQFTYGIQRPKVEKTYLIDAIEQVLAGQTVAVPYAEPVGCLIGRVRAPQANSDVTYCRQIARILQQRCVGCHRPGEIGPFSLTSYDEVAGWALMIDEVVQQQRMPPWHANPQYGHFRNEARLTEEEKTLISRWVEAGAPEGDPADLPPPVQFTQGWQIEQPDLVLYMSEKPFRVPSEGVVRYQYFVVDPGFKEDKWVRAAECRPGNRAVVHHIIVGVLPPAAKRGERLVGEGLGDWLVATAPGARPMVLPEGYAKRIAAGSKLVFQMHYTPNGTPQEDRSAVGLVFADPATVRWQVHTDEAVNRRFQIPPGAEDYKIEATRPFAQDTLLLALFPHMHLRGKAFRYTAIYADGTREILLDVPRYDFNWQNTYEFVEPKRMPRGSRLLCEAWYDNSEKNLANPDPTRTVRWGEQTWDEMMIGYFSSVRLDEVPQTGAPPSSKSSPSSPKSF